MDRVGPGLPGSGDHGIDVQVTLRCGIGPDPHGLISHRDMHRRRIRVGIDRDHMNAHAFCRTRDPHRDFAAVGDQQAFDHLSAPD